MHAGEGESMKLSTKGRYGLRALIDLAQYSGGDTPVSITSISDRQAISERYLEQLMAKLKESGACQERTGSRRRLHSGKGHPRNLSRRCTQSS